MTRDVIFLHLPRCPLWTLNSERRLNHFRRAELTATVRSLAAAEAVRIRTLIGTIKPPVGIEVGVTTGRRGPLADAGAYVGVAKAAIDGLVDAGMLPDDGPRYVQWVRLWAPVRGAESALEVRIVRCL
jgi:hypothetical protein